MSYYSSPSASINVGNVKVNNSLEIGNYNLPIAIGANGQFLGVNDDALAFLNANPGGGIVGVEIADNLNTFMEAELADNSVTLSIVENPTLRLEGLTIRSGDEATSYALPVLPNGSNIALGSVISYTGANTCTFVAPAVPTNYNYSFVSGGGAPVDGKLSIIQNGNVIFASLSMPAITVGADNTTTIVCTPTVAVPPEIFAGNGALTAVTVLNTATNSFIGSVSSVVNGTLTITISASNTGTVINIGTTAGTPSVSLGSWLINIPA
jgi:hypothetical protein